LFFVVMAGLVPAIHALTANKKDVDARVKPGHDEMRELRVRAEVNLSA
jgi:hypothetical protein